MTANDTRFRGTGGDAVAARLADLGIRALFSLPGSQVLPIWDGLARRTSLRLIVARTERHAAFMAEGYARATGAPAALTCTLGPGVANELSGLVSAGAQGGAPVVCVAPFHPPAKRDRLAEVFQGLDHPRFFAGACKKTVVVDSGGPDAIREALDDAFRIAAAEPRGVARVDIAHPLLFRKASARQWPAPIRPRLDPAMETPPSSRVIAVGEIHDLGLPPEATSPLAPGLPEGAIPFALGVKVAQPDQPLLLVTAVDALLADLGVLATAAAVGLETRLLFSIGDPRPAEIASALHLPAAQSSDARSALQISGEAPTALTILCLDRTGAAGHDGDRKTR